MNSGYQNDKDSNRNCFKWCGIAKPRKCQYWNILQRGKNDILRLPVAVRLCLRIRWKEVIPWLWKSRLINMSTKFSTPARPYSGSATRRNNSSAFPIRDQSRGCCCAVWALPARPWCEALSCILGQGGQKWRFGRFYEISNFHDKTHPRSRIVCIASRKQKSTMFHLKRSSRFDNS